MTIGNCCLIIAYILLIGLPFLGYTQLYALFGTAFMSIGKALAAATIWTCFPLIVPRHNLGIAFGVEVTLTCLGYILNPLVCGVIYDYVH
jgi:hypothetical protein